MLYPIATQTRQLIDLSGIWQFKFAEQDWQPMAVPGSFNDQLVLSEYKNYIGDFFYQTKFFVTEEMLKQRVFLRFGSVTHYAEVSINHKNVGKHSGGFTPFEFDITDAVVLGENIVTVKANNILDDTTLPVGNYTEIEGENGKIIKKVDENFDFFNYAGIHRPVRIWTKPLNYIDDITVTYELKGDQAKVNLIVDVIGKAEQIRISILDEQDQVVATSIGGKEQCLNIENVIRWQPMNAYLYRAVIEILESGKVEDSYIEPFGMRTVEIKNNQFLINDKPFYFKGYGRHEDTHINGRGLSNTANVMDINLMKWQGANSFRTSHYPYSEEMMRLADREGFVVIDETTAVGLMNNFGFTLQIDQSRNTWETLNTHEAHRQVIRELIKRDKNYACVVMWSIANEPSTAEKRCL